MLSESKFLTLRDKVDLHIQVREVDSPIWLVGTHGIGEHLGRHQYLHNLFSRDFNILLYDLRGHGKSGGRRAYVESFSDYYRDLEQIIEMLQNEYNMQRYVLFGHSMGGLITNGFLKNLKKSFLYPEFVYLSSPLVGVNGPLGKIIEFMPPIIFEKLAQLPSIDLPGIVDLSQLSHNSQVYNDYLEDPLNCTRLHVHLLLEMAIAVKKTYSNRIRFKCPAVCSYGSDDTIIDTEAIEDYFGRIEKSVLLKSFAGAWHEIHNETEKYRADYFDFMKQSFFNIIYEEQGKL